MNIKRQLLTTLAFLAVASQALAQEIPSFETVVEDVIFNTSTRTIIDEKTIRESRAPNITTLLSSEANVTITNSPIQQNSIFIRGGDAGHILILVDGVPFYDASTSQRIFNLNSLDVKAVKRIEIIKGSQTVLYGGQALSGIIRIDTIPKEFEQQTNMQARLGTQNTKDLAFTHTEFLSDSNALFLRGQGSWRDSQSPVLHSDKTYGKNSWNGETAYAWKGYNEGHAKAQFIQELNWSPTVGDADGKIYDTDSFEQFTKQMAASSQVYFSNTPWTPRLSAGIQGSSRQFKQPANAVNMSSTDQDYGANVNSVRLEATPFKSDVNQFTLGLSYLYEHFTYKDHGTEKVNKFSEQRGLFVKHDHKINHALSASAGGRVENWDENKAIFTYQLGLTILQNTKLEYSTGYKIPSLFQLYSEYGNPNLEEERSQQWSLTQDFPISQNQNLSITYFNSNFDNLIITRPAPGGGRGSYANVAKSSSRGFEVAYSLKPSDTSSIHFSYGYQEPRDGSRDSWLLRRPLVSGSMRYIYSSRPHSATLEIIGAGERFDRVRNSPNIRLPGYVVANASYGYQMDELLTLFGRVNNIANHRYEETFTYYSEGMSAIVGAEYTF